MEESVSGLLFFFPLGPFVTSQFIVPCRVCVSLYGIQCFLGRVKTTRLHICSPKQSSVKYILQRLFCKYHVAFAKPQTNDPTLTSRVAFGLRLQPRSVSGSEMERDVLSSKTNIWHTVFL